MTSNTVFRCSICGLHYEKKTLADECYAWCSTHRSCNLNTARQSLEARSKKVG